MAAIAALVCCAAFIAYFGHAFWRGKIPGDDEVILRLLVLVMALSGMFAALLFGQGM